MEAILDISLPNVCTEMPKPSMAFCEAHCALMEKQTPPIPTKLREFIAFCASINSTASSSLSGILEV